jgi:hypothetical protein
MSLKAEDFDFLSNLGTLWSVLLGALLATFGGLIGGQLEWLIESRRRERDAALFFAEVLSALKMLLDLAADTKKIGDPYGPITLRMLRSARREIDIYERNRENLYYLKNHELRGRVHTAIVRLTMPLDGMFDASSAIENLQTQQKSPLLDNDARSELERRLAQIAANREAGFEFLMQTSEQMKSLVDELGSLSGQTYDSIERAARAGL